MYAVNVCKGVCTSCVLCFLIADIVLGSMCCGGCVQAMCVSCVCCVCVGGWRVYVGVCARFVCVCGARRVCVVGGVCARRVVRVLCVCCGGVCITYMCVVCVVCVCVVRCACVWCV